MVVVVKYPRIAVKLLAENDLRTITQLINSVHETAEWTKYSAGYKYCLKEKAKIYEMHRSSHIQRHSTYIKDGSDHTRRKD